MIARKVAVRLKEGCLDKFVHILKNEILPWLRQQDGFLDVITLAAPDRGEVATITFWARGAGDHAYGGKGCPQALAILEEVLDGPVYVKTFEVVASTLDRLTPNDRVLMEALVNDTRDTAEDFNPLETRA